MLPAANSYDIVLDSPLGRLGVQLQDAVIIRLDYLGNRAVLKPATTAPGKQITRQLGSYFHNPQSRFSLPFELRGTDFQLRVWQALTQIPAGKTLAYGQLAQHGAE